MNNGKICVSICAKTAEDLFERIRQSKSLADIVEARFDCLDEVQVEQAINIADENWQELSNFLLATFRPAEYGGSRSISEVERSQFWFSGKERPYWGGDFEEDIVEESVYWLYFNRICSYHNFSRTPINLGEIYQRLTATSATAFKIAVQANDIIDTVKVWQLLELAKADNRQIIPIAMGEAGKWTRILGLAHGAFMTYASPEEGSETAPGQLSASDLVDVYRVKELDEETGVFGIIAGDTSYSVSPFLHNAAFKSSGLNSVFVPLQVGNLDEFMRRMVKPETREIKLNFQGFAVTNPHKLAILPHLDFVDNTAKVIGSVNTVKVENEKFYGYNTDAHGFIEPLRAFFGDLTDARVAVFGAGGVARACVYALKKERADVTLIARDLSKLKELAVEFGCRFLQLTTDHRQLTTAADIIVNATPLGTKGKLENETIAMADDLRGVKLVYDLVYNPIETRLIHEAKAAGVEALGGIEMLIAQGSKQFEIWTGKAAPISIMTRAVKERLT